MRFFWIFGIFFARFLVFGADEQKKLIFAQVFYRHGETSFTNNIEKLTPEGEIYTQKLGDFIQNRYSDFLANITLPEQYFQMLWTYENSQKCLESAKIVASRVLPNLPVAVTSNLKMLEILSPKFNKCPIEHKWFQEICPGAEFDRIFEDHSSYFSAISMCLATSNSETFRKVRFQDMETWLKDQLRNNSGNPGFHRIRENFYLMNQKMNGVQKGFGEGELMRIRYGKILGFLAENLRNAWDSKSLMKFQAISVEDWILMGLLEAFQIYEKVEFEKSPDFNTLLIIELWKTSENQAKIKIFYKNQESTEDNLEIDDLTEAVKNCQERPEENKEGCNLSDFLKGFEKFILKGDAC